MSDQTDQSSETSVEKVLRAKVIELERLRAAAMALVSESCREWLGEPTFDYCNQPAEFVLWGKLIPPEGLGPRCYEHAAKNIIHHGLYPGANYALMDLRAVRRETGMEPTRRITDRRMTG